MNIIKQDSQIYIKVPTTVFCDLVGQYSRAKMYDIGTFPLIIIPITQYMAIVRYKELEKIMTIKAIEESRNVHFSTLILPFVSAYPGINILPKAHPAKYSELKALIRFKYIPY